MATIGALITIVALAIDPFSQQIVALGQSNIMQSQNPAAVRQVERYSRESRQLSTNVEGLSNPVHEVVTTY